MIAEDQSSVPANFEILHNPLELVEFGLLTHAGVTPGSPDVAPDEPRAAVEIDRGFLVVSTAAKGDVGPWKQNELGVRGGLHPPLLGREAADCRMDPGRRLSGHHGSRARPRIDLHQVPIAVEQAGRRVEQVDERGKLSGELKRRQYAEGNLLVSRTKAGPPLLFDQR